MGLCRATVPTFSDAILVYLRDPLPVGDERPPGPSCCACAAPTGYPRGPGHRRLRPRGAGRCPRAAPGAARPDARRRAVRGASGRCARRGPPWRTPRLRGLARRPAPRCPSCSAPWRSASRRWASQVPDRWQPGDERTRLRADRPPCVLDAPLKWRKPRRVFVNSMSDLFHPQVPVGSSPRCSPSWAGIPATPPGSDEAPAAHGRAGPTRSQADGSSMWPALCGWARRSRTTLRLPGRPPARHAGGRAVPLPRAPARTAAFTRPDGIDWVIVGGETGPKDRAPWTWGGPARSSPRMSRGRGPAVREATRLMLGRQPRPRP